jgi:hypothetical protein
MKEVPIRLLFWRRKPVPATPERGPAILKEVEVKDRILPMAPLPFVVSLSCPNVRVVHQLRDVVNVLSILNQ